MKMLATRTALAITAAIAVLWSTSAADAQRYRPKPRSYDAYQQRPGNSRFTPEEQRIIDQITANDWRNGR